MKKLASLLTACFLSVLFLLPAPVSAVEQGVDTQRKIYDYADLFTDSEENTLVQDAQDAVSRMGADLVLVTIDDNEGLSSSGYAEQFYDENGFGTDGQGTGLLMLINMEDREIWITTTGEAMDVFGDNEISEMVGTAISFLSNGYYFEAAESFLSDAERLWNAAFEEEASDPGDEAQSVRVFDGAGLFSPDEALKLEEEVARLTSLYAADLVILTADDVEGLSSREYAEAFYDDNGFGAGFENTGLLFFINMADREVWITTTGEMQNLFGDREIDDMVDGAVERLSDGDYYGAALDFLDRAEIRLEDWVPGAEPEAPGMGEVLLERLGASASRAPLYLLLSAAGALVAVLLMRSSHNTVKAAREAGRYLNRDSIQMTLRRDDYLTSHISKVRIDTDSNNHSSNNGSFHSSGSHGGGGGSFSHSSHGGGGGHF